MKVMASSAMVTARPWLRSTAAMPPAWSMRDSTQPPKMSPLALVSPGMALMRTVSVPRGVSASLIVIRPRPGPLIRSGGPKRGGAAVASAER